MIFLTPNLDQAQQGGRGRRREAQIDQITNRSNKKKESKTKLPSEICKGEEEEFIPKSNLGLCSSCNQKGKEDENETKVMTCECNG